LLESIEVPRLSIIVPHLHDDSSLEVTLLSLLENRESDLEILIVHDGRYDDPYGLDQDEVTLIEAQPNAKLSDQLNLAVASAHGPVVQVLMPGVIVEPNWFDEALQIFRKQSTFAVCQPIVDASSNELFVGLSGESLPHRRVANSAKQTVAPLLCGGYFRKSVLEQIGGWLGACQREMAEVEMALLMASLELQVEVLTRNAMQAPNCVACGRESSYEIGRCCGQLACAYASISESGIAIDSMAQRLGHLAGGLMNPKSVAERLGWVLGIRDKSFVERVQSRFETACDTLSETVEVITMKRYSGSNEQKRAA
jgi:hypothetical protein